MNTFAYYGGKGMHLRQILPVVPYTHTYVEPFCGSAAVYMAKPQSKASILNDRDGRIVNMFRMLRDRSDELFHRVRLTPNARDEFTGLDYEGDDIERARQTIACLMMHRNHVVSDSNRKAYNWKKMFRTGGATNFMRLCDKLMPMVEKLQGAQIENCDAVELIEKCNSKPDMDCFIYVDPPYYPDSRSRGHENVYGVEMVAEEHEPLLMSLNRSTHRVMISGYHCELYDDMLDDWFCREWETHSPSTTARGDNDRSRAEKRVECVWINYNPTHDGGVAQLELL